MTGVVAAGQQAVLTTVASGRPVAMAPQAVMVPTQTVSRLLSPATSLSANTVQLPATLNVLQRQLSAPGTAIYRVKLHYSIDSCKTSWSLQAFVLRSSGFWSNLTAKFQGSNSEHSVAVRF